MIRAKKRPTSRAAVRRAGSSRASSGEDEERYNASWVVFGDPPEVHANAASISCSKIRFQDPSQNKNVPGQLHSSDYVFAPFLAPLILIINIIKVTVIGLGLVKDEGVVNSMTRHGDHRYMCYFSIFGFVDKSWTMVAAFGVISLVAAVVESLPISTRLDDNLTVPVASTLVGALVFYSIGARNLCCMSSQRQ
ncbi:hypothetical protein E2562_003330 [Oryza meyeriana var. granulata]|uniref:Uncharacterized protein n=1 Tax=Oryza meyeriana var. granulata TaxID=110450 RepID=A0A6G1EEB5_9ORYZ|nr:hypothetical protein E2562_003330 [Oryza meyeriana var. granulata]